MINLCIIQIPELKEIFDLKAFVCDGETLGEILKAPNGYQQTIEELSNELCMLNHNMVPVLTEAITGNINSTGVIQYVSMIIYIISTPGGTPDVYSGCWITTYSSN